MGVYREATYDDSMGWQLEEFSGQPTFRISDSEIRIFGLPMPPSENMSYPTGKHGMRFKSKDLKNFQSSMEKIRLVHIHDANQASKISTKWIDSGYLLSLELNFYFRTKRLITKENKSKRLDVQNRLKAACDSISEMLRFDDCNFWEIKISKLGFNTDNNEWCSARIRPFTNHL